MLKLATYQILAVHCCGYCCGYQLNGQFKLTLYFCLLLICSYHFTHKFRNVHPCFINSACSSLHCCCQSMQVLYPLVIEQLLKHEPQREKPQKEENGLYCCFFVCLMALQWSKRLTWEVTKFAHKLQTLRWNWMILWWEEDHCNLGGKPISFGCSANCLRF